MASDLSLNSVTGVPASATLGESFDVSWVVDNLSSADTINSWYDEVYLSDDTVLDFENDLYLADYRYSQVLGAGSSYTATRNISIPNTLVGDRYLLFITDVYGDEIELNEDNNLTAIPINLTAPELVVSAATAPATVSADGNSVQLSWTVTNQGTVATDAAWYDYVYISNDETLDSQDTFITERWAGNNAPLAAGGSYTATQPATLPRQTAGDRYLLFVTDGSGNQGETDETNNVRAVPIEYVTGGADLVVSAAMAPAIATLGNSIAISWTVTNQGNFLAQADWSDQIYVSNDEILDDSDTFVQSFSLNTQMPLAEGASYSRNETINLLGTTLGDRYLLFVSDRDNTQGETDETNNTRAVAINLTAPPVVGTLSALDSSINGSLSTTDTRNLTRTERYSDDYQLTDFTVGEPVILDLSAPFDAYLQLINADTQQVITEDDDSGPGYDSQIQFTPVEGVNYIARTTSFRSNATGNYTLFATTATANLVVTAATAPEAAILGETVQLSWTVANQGTGTARTDWNDYVYFSSDTTLDNSDTFVASAFINSQTPLAPGANYTITQNVSLPSTTVENGYLLFVADRFSNQLESNEADNSRAVAISLSAPDLTVSAANAPETGILGQPIAVSWTVTNQGTTAAPANWTDRIYVSNDMILDSSDTFVTSEFINTQTPLAAGASYIIDQNIALPRTTIGDRYLLFAADYFNAQGETNETNNVRAVPILLTAPDLVVSSITAPVEAISGQQIELVWAVSNQGTVDATGTWTDHVYLSNDGVVGSDRFIDDFSFTGTIAAGQSLERRQLITVPLDLSGEQRFVISTDVFDQLPESTGNQANNTAIDDRPIQVQLSPFPNLQVSSVTAPPTAFSSQETEIQWTVTNIGNGATNASFWYDSVWLSLDNTIDNTDVYLGRATNASYLNVGESYTNSLTVKLPRGIDNTYYFLIQADSSNQVLEFQNEGDNFRAGDPTDVDLTPPPDLQITAANAPARGFSGQTIPLSWTVSNNGTGRNLETSWYDNVYLSVDEVLDEGDRLLGSFSQGAILNPGDNYRPSYQVTLPVGVSGDFYVFVRSDAGDSVYEHISEGNNTDYDATPINVTLTPPPDLVVSSATADSTAQAGKGLRVQWMITNQGFGDTFSTFWSDRVIASKDEIVGNGDDITLATFSRSGLLDVDESYSRDESITVPFNFEGAYQVFVVTDAGNSVFELTEENNISSALPVTVIPAEKPDLRVTQVSAPTTAQSGTPLTVNWTIQNFGTGRTNSNFWYDSVYLSTDTVLSDDDRLLGNIFHSGVLEPADQYARTATFNIPIDTNGTFYTLIQTDRYDEVAEGALEGNNTLTAATTTAISLSPVPNLVLQSIDAPTTGISGQSIILNWTVANNGAATGSRDWYDAFYLSRDQVFDRNSDSFLGYADNAGGLTSGASYTKTQSFNIPRGLSGSYYVFAVTDGGDSIYERNGEQNNVAYDGFSMQVSRSQPADLVVETITIPVSGVLGQSASVSYTVKNQGENPALGSWTDSVYISTDNQWDINDALVGRVQHSGDVSGGSSYSETLIAPLPGVLPGDYYVIVRSDIRNQTSEINEINNTTVSQNQITVDVQELSLNTLNDGTLSRNQATYYRVNVGAGESLLIDFDSSSTNAFNELYVSFGELPNRSDFDFGFTQSFEADQRVLVPTTQEGTYYILAYGNGVSEDTANYSIEAKIIDFAVLDTNYGLGGTSGNRTIEINGNKFDRTVTARLTDENGFSLAATSYYWVDSSRMYATFDLTKAAPGTYDVVVEKGSSNVAVVDDGFQVVAGGGGNNRPDLTVPRSVRRDANYSFTVSWGNDGINDIPVPLLQVSSTAPFGFVPGDSSAGTSHTFLALNKEDGPPGILRPGQYQTATFFSYSDNQPGDYTVSVDRLFKDLSSPFDWNSIRQELTPIGMSDAQFQPIFEQLINQVGTTNGDYLQMLVQNAALLPEELGSNSNIGALLDLELQKAKAVVGTSISGKISAPDFNFDLSGRTVIATNTSNSQSFSSITLNDGSFIFESLPPSIYTFKVESAVIAEQSTINVNVLSGEALMGVEISVEKGATIAGRATLGETNQVVANAFISVFSGDQVIAATQSDSEGNFSIPGLTPGNYALQVESAGLSRTWIDNISLATANLSVNISLLPEASMTGQITSESGNLPDEILIVAKRQGDSGNSRFFAFSTDGSFNLNSLSAGVYNIEFVGKDSSYATLQGVEVSTSTSLNIGTVTLQATGAANSSLQSANSQNEFNSQGIADNLWETYLDTMEPIVRTEILALAGGIGGPGSYELFRRYFDSNGENLVVPISEGSQISNSFKYHPITRLNLLQIQHEALKILEEKWKDLSLPCDHEEIRLTPKPISIESLNIPSKDRLFVIGEKSPAASYWNFPFWYDAAGVVAGGVGDGGGPVGGSFGPDARFVTGTVDVVVPKGSSQASVNFDLYVTVTDTVDFDPGNIVFVGSPFWEARILERNGRAFDVPFTATFKASASPLSFDIDLEDDCDCEDKDDCDEIPRPPSYDPNDILGPNGFSEENWITASEKLNYTIRFENDKNLAQAPAQTVRITQQLDSDLDFRTFRVGDFNFGSIFIDLQENQPFYQNRLDLTETLGIFVDVAAGIDIAKGEAFWEFTSIDPATGELPVDALTGFLPPNIDGIEGQGFVNYSIRPKSNIATGTIIDAKATIIFDINEPIGTPPIFNTLDADKPTSNVEVLPITTENPEFLVRWTGEDIPNGSALASYTIYVSINGGEFIPWLENTTLTEATYTAQLGRNYAFYSVARDNAGNTEAAPTSADATTRVAGDAPASLGDLVWHDLNANGIRDTGEAGLANVTVKLYDNTDTLIATATTDSTGAYRFDNLNPGTYSVEVVPEAGYHFSPQDQGSNEAVDSDVDVTTGRIASITLNGGDNRLDVDTGVYQLATIQGQKFNDLDGDGVKDSTEPGLNGWTIYLDANTNGQLDDSELLTTTDATGNYQFTNLRPGTYTVTEVMQEGWQQTFPGIDITTTGAAIPIYTPSTPETLTSSTISTTASQLISLDTFRSDSRFTGINGRGFASVSIDTGIDLDHPFFGSDANEDGIADRIVYQYDFADNDGDASDRNGHGSHIASIIGSSDSVYSGIAPEANLIALKVFKDNGSGYFSDLEESLQWVVNNASTYNIASVNLSLGDERNWNTETSRYGIGDELAALTGLGVIVTAAAGNNFAQFSSTQGLAYPAADPNAIAVGAVWSTTDQIADFSQRHASFSDVFAPGIPIVGANATGGTTTLGGTSQASPHIAGIAVLAQEIATEKLGRKLTVNEFRSLLTTTSVLINDGDDETDNVTNTGLNFPRINLLALAEGILKLSSEAPNPDAIDPGADSTTTPSPVPVNTQAFAHIVTLSSGQIATDIDFGNQRLNQPPALATNLGLTVDEQAIAAIPVTRLQVTDSDNLATELIYTLTALPTSGSLQLNGTPLLVNTTFNQDDINNNRLAYHHNGSETISDSFSFTVADGAGGTIDNTTFTIQITPVNDRPKIVNAIAHQTATEDTLFSFQIPVTTFDDVDPGDRLTYRATLENNISLPTWLTFNPETQTFSGTPTNEDIGILPIQVTVTDIAGASTTTLFNLAIANTNDPPIVVNPIAHQTATEDTLFSFTIPDNTFSDADADDTLTYNASLESGDALPTWLTFDASTHTLNGTPTNENVGVLAIKVRVTDSANAIAENLFTLAIANTNDAPVLVNSIPDQTATEDSLFTFQIPTTTFSDVDAGDQLLYTATLENGNSLPSWLTVDPNTRILTGTPTNDNVDTLKLKVIATDTAGATAAAIVTLAVTNINDAPTLITAIANQTATENTLFTFTIPANTFSDVDTDDILTYSTLLENGNSLPTWLTFDASTRTLSGTPTNNEVGTLQLKVTATDIQGATASSRFNLSLNNINTPPIVNQAIANQIATEDQIFSFQLATDTFTDIDLNDHLSYTATQTNGNSLPSWLIFDADAKTFGGTPTNIDVGAIGIQLTATDNDGLSTITDFELVVNNVNDAPTVANLIVNQNAIEDAPFTFQLPANTFTDVDTGDSLTYTATFAQGNALPAWLSFDANTHTFSGTPTNGDVGTLDIRATATDTQGAITNTVFNLAIANVNDAPILNEAIGDSTAVANQLFSLTLAANAFIDIDADDRLTYTATLTNGEPLPAWLSFDPNTGTFSGVPNRNDTASLSIQVMATDLTGANSSDVFGLEVTRGQLELPRVNNRIKGTRRGDRLKGTRRGDRISGRGGNDDIRGLGGDDILLGDGGNDTLIGGNGNDVLLGGQGGDSLWGNQGNDVFALGSNQGRDTINDFQDGQDFIGLLNGLTYSSLVIRQIDGATEIGTQDSNEILAILTGISANVITAADFVSV